MGSMELFGEEKIWSKKIRIDAVFLTEPGLLPQN